MGIAQQRFVVVGSGQIQERKGVFDFIQLAEQNPDVQFIWAGGFSFGRITDGYAALKRSLTIRRQTLNFQESSVGKRLLS